MSDRKWLNLVIFLISVMILLFLIINKNMNKQSPSVIPQQSINHPTKLPSSLIELNFKPTFLRINRRWIPVEQIQTEIGLQQWEEFENAWKSAQPASISSLQNISSNKFYSLVWDDGINKKTFKFIPSTDMLQLQRSDQPSTIYYYNSIQAKLLFPAWLKDKTRLE